MGVSYDIHLGLVSIGSNIRLNLRKIQNTLSLRGDYILYASPILILRIDYL